MAVPGRPSPIAEMISTERQRLALIGFYGLAVLFAYLVYLLFRPFLVPLAWAGVFVICFYPTHSRFEERLGRTRAALVSTVMVALLVIVPMLMVGSAFVSEASRVLGSIPVLLARLPESMLGWLQPALLSVPGGETIDAGALLGDSARRLAALLSGQAASILQDTLLFIVYLVMTIFAMFFFFRDAPTVMRGIRRLLPFHRDLVEQLIEQTRMMVNASVTSSLIVAAVQGLLGGLAFWLVGLSAPVFWGVVMAVVCLLPLGAWLVWVPASVWLVLSGSVGRGLVLAGIGVGIVSGVDNFLRPILLSERSGMNGLLLFVSLLGGVTAFGAVGLVLGPVLMATAVGLFEAYTTSSVVSSLSDE